MLGPEAEERLEAGHRSTAPVEAVGELVEVGLEMAMANAVVGAAEPRLQIAEDAVDAGEDLDRALRVTLCSGSVLVTHARKGRVCAPPIRQHKRTPLDIGFHEPGEGPSRGIGNDLKAYPARGFAADLDRAYDERLFNQFPASSQPRLGPADIGLVHLDLVLQRLTARTHHGPSELVQHRPGCLTPSDAQLALELEGRQARRLRRHQVRCPEPLSERHAGPMQHGPGRHRSVVATGLAPPQQPPQQLARLSMATSGAPEPIGPPGLSQVLPASRLIDEADPKLVHRPRKVRSHTTQRYPLGLVESTG